VIVDADLTGADALVVAAESNDDDLIQKILSGYDLHTENANELFGPEFSNLPPKHHRRHAIRQQLKSGVHGTNYGAAARTLAVTFGWRVAVAERFQTNWFRKHPGVKDWHFRVQADLRLHRRVSNKFGYRIIYFDRLDSLFTQALAWIPQSTVAEVCFRGALHIENSFPFIQMLLQVHDSLVFQIPSHRFEPGTIEAIRKTLSSISVPYPNPLFIPWKLSASTVSWGDCEEIKS